MSPPAPILTRLVLFDIDGTIVLTGGAGARAMTLALRDMLGVENGFDGIAMPGRTDQLILLDALARGGHPNDPELLREFQERYSSISRGKSIIPPRASSEGRCRGCAS